MYRFVYTAILTLFFVFLWKYFVPAPRKNLEKVNQFWFDKTFASSTYDILVCGDSRIYRGVSIEEMLQPIGEEFTGLNLGYSSAGLSSEFMDFVVSKFRIDSKLKILIIGITPHALTKEAFKNESLEENKVVSTAERFRYRYLSPWLNHFSPHKLNEFATDNPENYQEKYETKGWVSSDYKVRDTTLALEGYRKTFTDYQSTKNEQIAFLNNLREIQKKGIIVLLFRPPTTLAMQQLEDSLSGLDIAKFKRQVIEIGANWYEPKLSDFQTYDGSHLESESAKKLSRLIGLKVKSLMN